MSAHVCAPNMAVSTTATMTSGMSGIRFMLDHNTHRGAV